MYRNQSAITLRDTLARPTLSAGFVGDDALREELREQVFTAVDDMKRMQWPPERVIMAVKQLARDGGLVPSFRVFNAGASLSNGDTVLASVIRWAIERYFTTNN